MRKTRRSPSAVRISTRRKGRSAGYLLPLSGPGEDDLRIGDDTAAGGHRARRDHRVGGVVLHPGHEHDAGLGQLREPREVEIAAIHHQDRAGRIRLLTRHGDLVLRALGDHQRRGEVAVMIEREMELHRALGPAERGPREHLRTQVDDGGVDRHQLVLEAELLLAGRRLAPAQQLVEDTLVQLPRPMRVGVGERRARRRGDPEVRELPFTTGQPAADLPQRMCAPQLTEQHGDELSPAREAARMAFGARRPHGLLELAAGKELEYLTEHAAESDQGVALRGGCREP